MSPSRLSSGSAALGNVQQRRHDRYQVEIPGLLSLQHVRGGIYAITVLDISRTGLRISCPKSFPSETKVEVKCKGIKILGAVKYTREVGSEIYLGIQVEIVDPAPTAVGTEPAAEVDLLSLFPMDANRLKRP